MSAMNDRHDRPTSKSRWPRYMLVAFLVMLMPFVLVATAIAATGTVTVRLNDTSADGISLFVPVPALLVDVAALVVPRVLPDEVLADVRREVAPYRDGLLAMVEAIEDCPSGNLVDVRTGSEHVVVEKAGSRFRISVDTHDLDLDISVPARFARRALQMIDVI